jgi:ATP-binding cassette, subfamily B, bacterial
MRGFFSQTHSFAIAVFDMIKTAWQAHPLSFICLFLIEGFQGLVPIAFVWITKTLFDLLAKSFQTGSFAELPEYLILILGLQVLLSIFTQLTAHMGVYLNNELTRRLTLSVQSRVYEKINGLQGIAPFETSHFYDAIQLAAQGAQFGPSQILSTLTSLVKSIITLISFIGILIAFSPLLAGLVILAALPQLYAQIKMGGQRHKILFQTTPKERQANYYGHVLTAADFSKEIRLFNLGEYFLKAFQRLSLEVHGIQRRQQMRETWWRSGLSLLSSLVSSGTFIVVILQAFSGRLSLGDITLYTSAGEIIQAALYAIISAIASVNEGILFFTRYTDLLALAQPISIPLISRPALPLITSIEFRDVSFKYSDEHPWILRNFSLSLPAGQCVALVGLNGAGKTTLIKLLTRMYDPTEGSILWDGIDIREFDPVDFRRHIGAIFQDFVQFDLTAFENIALGDIHRLENSGFVDTHEFVHQAAGKADIHEVLTNLPQGYETILSRWLTEDGHGVDLSGGEWQKVALARMLMRNADVLILDEPTAALDPQAEFDIYNKFMGLVDGKTSFLISHRFSTVRMANVIAVLEDGKISEYGSHEQLLSLGGTYAKLYAMQADRYK